ncbi:hypothetical protein MLD38_003484 [Melastoma candidum]|uniref:Uncharacterized protein n=1 Tax=Melastoma candidum TaxID=119954 RepID=A0ACB9SB91_9MYRT|nr:hypothetical protein MLD38_003484 [Melastoma candidum]
MAAGWRRRRKDKMSFRTITEDEIASYVAKKALKKAMRAWLRSCRYGPIPGVLRLLKSFRNSNLNEKLVSKNKIERDVARGAGHDMFSVKAEKIRQMERVAGGKSRRVERKEHEEEIALLNREAGGRGLAEFQDWVKKEEDVWNCVEVNYGGPHGRRLINWPEQALLNWPNHYQ